MTSYGAHGGYPFSWFSHTYIDIFQNFCTWTRKSWSNRSRPILLYNVVCKFGWILSRLDPIRFTSTGMNTISVNECIIHYCSFSAFSKNVLQQIWHNDKRMRNVETWDKSSQFFPFFFNVFSVNKSITYCHC